MKSNEIINRLKKMEGTLNSLEAKVLLCADYYKSKIRQRDDYNVLINSGIDGLKEKIMKENLLMLMKHRVLFLKENLLKKLRQPHRKIIDYLAYLHDTARGKYREVHFTKLVKDCRIGKNKANEYLRFLAENGLVERRDDGYRVWFKFSDQSACEDNSG